MIMFGKQCWPFPPRLKSLNFDGRKTFSSKIVYYESSDQCSEKTNPAFDVSIGKMWNKVCSFESCQEKYQSILKISKYFTCPEF